MRTFNKQKRPAAFVLPLAVLAGLAYLVYTARNAAFPFILSVSVAYLINPLITFFEVRGIKRLYAVAAFYVVAGAILTFLAIYLSSLASQEMTLLQNEWPVYLKKIQNLLFNLQAKLAKQSPYLKTVYASWEGHLGELLASYVKEIPAFILNLVPALSLLILVPFITFFFLLEGPRMLDTILDLLPSKHVEMALHIVSEMDESLGNYLRGILAEATTLFLLALGGLLLMKLDYAVAIAAVVGVTSLIPYLGSLAGGLTAAIAAFLQYYSIWPVLNVLLFFAGLRFVDDWFLQPLILKRAVELHPGVILFSLLCGGELFGIWGLIFAIPVACMLKVVLQIAMELHRTQFGWRPRPEPARISIPYT